MALSCKDCASCIPADEVPVALRRTTEADVCFQHGHILSRPGQSDAENERIKIAFADGCPNYGQPRAAMPPEFIQAHVAVGDPQIMVKMSSMTVDPTDKPTTCTGCEHFVPANVVRRELGWALGACAAKGRLLFTSRYVQEANACGVSLKGTNRDTTDGMIMLPQYDGTGGATIAMSHGIAPGEEDRLRHAVDPRTYETDREVTEYDASQSIRAWRKVLDPEGIHDPIFMPIFNGEALVGYDPRTTYGGHRPDLYIDHQGLLYDLCTEWLDLDETPVIIGPAGSGKTELLCWFAYLMDIPFARVSVEKNTEASDFIGEGKLVTDPVSGTPVTTFEMGRFSKWYGSVACVICVDEANLKNDIYEFLRPAIDNAKQLVLDRAQGLTITRGRAVFLGLTQNPSWDPLYVGTEPMSAADIDRITPMFLDLPSENVEREIIRAHCKDDGYELPEVILDKIMQVAVDLRTQIADGGLTIAWGLRAQIKVARKTRRYSFEKAYRRALVDGMEPEVVTQIMASVRSVMA